MKIKAITQVSQDNHNWTTLGDEDMYPTSLLVQYAFVRSRLIYMPEAEDDEVFILPLPRETKHDRS